MNKVLWIFLTGLIVCGCSGVKFGCEGGAKVIDAAVIDAPVDAPPDASPPVVITKTFQESIELILNPERGFYTSLDLTKTGKAALVREAGYTLAFSFVRLDDYRLSALPDAFLNTLNNGLAEARAAGIKVILRFAYNKTATGDDTILEVVLSHIEQLRPLLENNADVIATVQAGFIGAWGEWHSSTNGLDTLAARSAILTALLGALPESRRVELRTPMFKEAILPGGPLLLPEAFSNSPRARVGHHNDCFLASNSDYGTYAAPITQWKTYIAQDSKYVSMGGETCAVFSPRSDCTIALEELAAHHWTYLNWLYNQQVYNRWQEQGCLFEVKRRLGYRFVARSLEYSTPITQTSLKATITLDNVGFASPINRRPVYAVLSNSSDEYVFSSPIDARTWLPGQAITVDLDLPMMEIPKGAYQLSLWLPDDAVNLRSDPRNAIRFANEGTWDESSGRNALAIIEVE